MASNAAIGVGVLAALLLSGCAATDWRASQRDLGISAMLVEPPPLPPLAPPPHSQDMSDFVGDNPNRVSASVGGAFEGGDSGFLIGADYEYRVKQGIGLGGLIEYAAGQLDSTALAAAVYFHPNDLVRLVVASGFENQDGDNDFLLRLGVSTQFPMENDLSLEPRFAIDFVDGDTKLVFAVGISFSF